MRAPALAALAACGLVGCGPGNLPLPRILSVEPSTMTSSSSVQALITVEAVLPFDADYNKGDITVDRLLAASVGNVPVGSGLYQPDGLLDARIPSKLLPGPHEVTVRLQDGRTGVLDGGFTVTPGLWPSSGFAVAPIATTQHVGAAFALTITAQGTGAATFNGTVDYVIPNVGQFTTSPFDGGTRQESVTIGQVSMGMIHITVVDLLGRITTSNDFIVTP
jgi:hypothetical protein